MTGDEDDIANADDGADGVQEEHSDDDAQNLGDDAAAVRLPRIGPPMPDFYSGLLPNFKTIMPDYSSVFAAMQPELLRQHKTLLSTLAGMGDFRKAVMPDVSGLVPQYDFAKMAGLDFSHLLDQLDPLRGAGTGSLATRLVNLDLGHLFVPRIDFPRIAETLKRQWQETQPPNWPEDSYDDIDRVSDILNDEGIPLVWVPRAEIIKELLPAADRAARIAILVDRRDDVVVDCQAVIAQITHSRLMDQHPLAVEAVRALAAGHDQPAQALAVVVTETAVKRAIVGSYKSVSQRVKLDVDDVPFAAFRAKAAMAPIGSFFTTWFPGLGPAPEQLSRHVSVHQADTLHYTTENAIVAVLLMASVLRELEETWTLKEPPQT